mmetsp:Transcript_94190/g.177194  ORF Transcript_94190/g.177194 Transcript_94190/m.177194 type:complete len:442 (-) Transcript_94190:3-1328(-)
MAHLLEKSLSRCPRAACTCLALLLLQGAAASDAHVQECQSSTCTDRKLSAEILDIADEGGPNMLQTRARLQDFAGDLATKLASSEHSLEGSKSGRAELAIKLDDLRSNLDLARTTSELQASLFQESSRYLDNITMEAASVQARVGRDMTVLEKAGLALQEASRVVMGLEAGEGREFSEEVQVGKDLSTAIKHLQKVWERHADAFGQDEVDAMHYAVFKASQAEATMHKLTGKHDADMKSVKTILLDAADAAKVIMSMTQQHRSSQDLKGVALQSVGALQARVGDCREASKAILLALSDATQKAQDAQTSLKLADAHAGDRASRLEEKLEQAEAQKELARQEATQAEQATSEAMQMNREALQELKKLRALNKDLEDQLQAALTEKSKTHHQMEYMKTQLDLASSQLKSPQEALNLLRESGKPMQAQEEMRDGLAASRLSSYD